MSVRSTKRIDATIPGHYQDLIASMTADPIRVLVVDDTVVFRSIISKVLSTIPGIEVVGTAANGKIALTKLAELKPDLLTLDLEMPELDGVGVLRQLRKDNSDVGAIVLSGTSGEGAAATMEALKLGAFDFTAKPQGCGEAENLKKLQQDLQPKIEAFARQKSVQKILHAPASSPQGATPSTSASVPTRPASEPTRRSQIDVVAIGISTGGPQALNQVLPQFPANFSKPVLIVQHMPALFTKSLADDLNARCAIAISEAVDGQPVRPGEVLIAPGGKQMKVVGTRNNATIKVTDDAPEAGCCPSVNYMFRSIDTVYGGNSIGLIMTGMGNDGTEGCRDLKRRGATIIAQDEASCVVFGMPRALVEEGIADFVLPLDTITAKLVQLTSSGATSCR